MNSKKKILIVDDDVFSIMLIKACLSHFGFDGTLLTALNGNSAIEKADKHEPDVVIMDVHLIGLPDGITAAEIIKLRHKNTAIVFVTGCTEEETRKAAAKLNPLAYITKPIDISELNQVLRFFFKAFGAEIKLENKELVRS